MPDLRKYLQVVALWLLGASALLAGPANAEEIRLWHAYRGEEKAALENLLERFNATVGHNSGHKVIPLAIPFDSYADKLSAALPRGRGPDLFIFAHDRIGGWALSGNTIAAVDDFASAAILERFPQPLRDAMSFEGKLYGLPFNFKSVALIYNRDLVPEPPATAADMLALAKKHTDQARGHFGLAFEYTEPFYHGALLNAGGGAFSADGELQVDSSGAVGALHTLREWLATGALPSEPTSALVSGLFNQGRAAMVINGPWMLSEIDPAINYGVAPLPLLDNGEPLSPWAAVEGLFLSPASKHPQAAWALMEFLTSDEAALEMATTGKQLPANSAAFSFPEVQQNPVAMAFHKQLDTAQPIPNLAEMTLLWTPLRTALQRTVKGTATPEEAARELQAGVQQDIDTLRAQQQALANQQNAQAAPLWPWLLIPAGLIAFLLTGNRRRRIAAGLQEHRTAASFVGPAAIGMLVLVFFPLAYGLLLSFTDTTMFNEHTPLSSRWAGLDNYVAILSDWRIWNESGVRFDNFYWTLGITIAWTLVNLALTVLLGLGLALALNKPFRGRNLVRVLLILPWAIPNYITALIWKGLFHPQFGAINQFVVLLGGDPVAWFDTVTASFFTGVITNVWLGFPFMMLVILGGLQTIPSDLYEAARMEGASRWQQFRRITLPMLRPTLLPAVVMSVIWTFNMFNVIYLVSDGAPAGANDILITKAFRIGFEKYQYAYASAYSTIVLLLLLAYAIWQTRVTRMTEAAK